MGVIDDIVSFITGVIDDWADSFYRDSFGNSGTLTRGAQKRVFESENPRQQFQKEVQEGNTRNLGSKEPDRIADLLGELPESLEQAIVNEFDPEQVRDLSQVNEEITNAEGAAVAETAGAIGTMVAIEALSAGQIDTHGAAISQVLGFLALEDLLGLELQAVVEEGVMPSLEAQTGKQYRTQFVNLNDAVEYALRQKESDTDWLHASGAGGDTTEVVGSNEPVNPENLLEEWGIRDDQLRLLELTAMSVPEPEELFEELPQYGVVPSDEAVEKVLNLSGFPEQLKDEFLRLNSNIPRSADLWEQRTTSGDLVKELDTLVLDGELTPEAAMALLPDELDESRPALRERWRLMTGLPSSSPTRSQVESSFNWGLIGREEFEARLADVDVSPEKYPDIVDEIVLDAAGGDMQKALAFGLMDEQTYSDRLASAGMSDEAIAELAAGASDTKLARRLLSEKAPAGGRPVGSISGIGESRAAGLVAVGIETIADLAAADIQTVSDGAQVSNTEATKFINQARARMDQDPLSAPVTDEEGPRIEDLSTVNDAEASLLRQEGFDDVAAVADADPSVVAEILSIREQTAREIVAQATELTS